MARELKRFVLNREALDFIESQLKIGFTISRLLAERVRSTAKDIWTILPQYVNINQIYSFDSGGICDIDLSLEIAQFIHDRLLEDENIYWILEDNTGDHTHPGRNNPIDGVTIPFSYEYEMYQLLRRDRLSVEAVQKTFKFGGAYPYVGFLTGLDSSAMRRIANEVTRLELEKIAQGVQTIVIGAYDEESYLVVDFPRA